MVFFDLNIEKLTRKKPKGSLVSIEYIILTSFMVFYTKLGSFYGPEYHFSCSSYIYIYCNMMSKSIIMI